MKKYLFNQLVIDDTSKFKKIKKENYLKEGTFSIVDQGKALIAGYTNDITFINQTNIPIIIFGDHTRVFKYIDFPIALGADGVKALTINKKLAYCKYIYYFFKSVILPDAGYSRHFKYLKDVRIPVPENYDDQIRISAILTKAEALIAKRKESIMALDKLLKSIFIDMFGDPLRMRSQPKEKLNKFITFLTSGSRGWAQYYSDKGNIFIRINNVRNACLKLDDIIYVNPPDNAEAVRTKVKTNDLLFSITADIGRTAVVNESLNGAFINQHLALIRLNQKRINPVFVSWYFTMPFGKSIVMKKNREGVKAGLNFDDIRGFEIVTPPLELQNQFAEIVEKVEAIKVKYTQSLNELDNLYNSLSQSAFKGELDLSRIPVCEDIEFGETKIEYELPEIETKKPFSEKELKKQIKQKTLKSFTFNQLLEEINNNFDKVPGYDRIKKMIFDMLEGKKPILTQTFDHDKKEIVLKVKV